MDAMTERMKERKKERKKERMEERKKERKKERKNDCTIEKKEKQADTSTDAMHPRMQ
jgi:hypothetical protein